MGHIYLKVVCACYHVARSVLIITFNVCLGNGGELGDELAHAAYLLRPAIHVETLPVVHVGSVPGAGIHTGCYKKW